MNHEVNNYNNAIVDNTDPNKRIVILTDQQKQYIQIFFTDDLDIDLIERTKLMRDIGIKSYK